MRSLYVLAIAAVVLVGCGPRMSIHEAARNGDIEVVKQHLAADVDVNAKDDLGKTPLFSAALEGHKEIAELLIDKGADVDAKDIDGYTPLYFTIDLGQKEMAELLITKGADVNAVDNGIDTPLHKAAAFSKHEIIELLIANGANVNAKDGLDRTPFDFTKAPNKIEKSEHGGKTAEELKAEAQPTIDLGYYCLSCKKTENITAYRDDFPNNWRQYPGGGSDSVLYCIKCKKGKAHPVNDCKICGTVFILHLFPKYDEYGDPSCPKCDTAYGNMAKSRGIDLMPKELKAEGK